MALLLVNTASGSADASSTSLAAGAANHTAGNLIVVKCFWSNNVNATVPTDTAGNTYVSTGIKANNGTTDHVETFYAKNISGNASNIVTLHFSAGATFRRIIVHQYSGADTTAPFTTGEGNTGTGTGSSLATASWTTATANEVLVGGIGGSAAFTSIVAGASYTKRVDLGDSVSEDRIVAATGTYTSSFSWTGSVTAWEGGASFKQAGAGGTAWTLTPSDTLTLTDAVVKALGLKKADTTTLSDALVKSLGLSKSDTFTLADALVKSAGLKKADTLTLSDALSKGLGLGKGDSITLSDSFGRTWTITRTFADTLTATDALGKNVGLGRADYFTLSDLASPLLGVAWSLTPADTISLADALGKGVGLTRAESLSLTDAVAKNMRLGKSDSLALTDAVVKAIGKKAADQLVMSDSLIRLLNGLPPDVAARVIRHLYATKFGFY